MTFPVQAWQYLVNAADPRPMTVRLDVLTLRVSSAAAALLALLAGGAGAPFALWVIAVAFPAIALGHLAGRSAMRASAAASRTSDWAAADGTALAAVSLAFMVLGFALAGALRPAIGPAGALALSSLCDFAGLYGAGVALAARRRRQ